MALDATHNPIVLTVAAAGSQAWTPDGGVPAAIQEMVLSRDATGVGTGAAGTQVVVNSQTVFSQQIAANEAVSIPVYGNATSVSVTDAATNTLLRLAVHLR